MTSIGSFLEDSLGHDLAHPKSGLKERKVHFGRTVHCCLPEKRKMIPQHIVEQVSVNCFVVQMCYLLMFFFEDGRYLRLPTVHRKVKDLPEIDDMLQRWWGNDCHAKRIRLEMQRFFGLEVF